jgi:hypothetical protein
MPKYRPSIPYSLAVFNVNFAIDGAEHNMDQQPSAFTGTCRVNLQRLLPRSDESYS